MSNATLGDYLSQLKAQSPTEILEFSTPVSRDYILMALATELDRRSQPPVILTRIEGYKEVVVANIFANRQRIAAILGCRSEEISQHWSMIERILVPPVMVEQGCVQEEIQQGDEIDVSKLPIMQHYSTDAGRYITAGIVVAKDSETGVRNLSFHRLQLKGANKFGISLHSR